MSGERTRTRFVYESQGISLITEVFLVRDDLDSEQITLICPSR